MMQDMKEKIRQEMEEREKALSQEMMINQQFRNAKQELIEQQI